MNISTEKKVAVFKSALEIIKKDFNIIPMLEFADKYQNWLEGLKEIKMK